MKKRNGDIAIVKFVFLVLIIVMHYNVPFPGKLYAFEGAYVYVDFFFVIMGYYITNSLKTENEAIRGAYLYMWNRIKRFFPLVLVETILLIFLDGLFFCRNTKELMKLLVYSVADTTFISQICPTMCSHNGTMWFLSATIIVGGIICFIFAKYKELCIFMAPIVGIGLYNNILVKNNNLDAWYGFVTCRYFHDGLLRALAGMLLGIFVRYLVDIYKDNMFEIKDVLLIGIECVSIVSSICLALLLPHTIFDFVQIALFMIIIAACNMRKEPLRGALFYYIDRITFPMYIFQVISIRMVTIVFHSITWLHMVVILIIDFAISNVVVKFVDLFSLRKESARK